MRERSRIILAIAVTLVLVAPATRAAGVTSTVDGSQAVVTGVEAGDGYLRVSGPDGISTFDVRDGVVPVFGLFDGAGNLRPDGSYTWELNVGPVLSASDREAMAEARRAGIGDIGFTGVKGSGYWVIHGGAFVTPAEDEVETPPARAVGPGEDPERDFVILDDLIVDGSACIGFDCVNGEVFGFDTVRLKENNLRIKFDDTSVAGSYPNNDWQLTANDSANGGANKFSIDDISGGRTPFTVEANAPSHSLYVDDGGRIGNGTSTPSVEIHTVDGDTPTLRLQQDGSSGFTPQTWDVAGNETNFFVRDVTNGSTLPFRIRPGAPSSSIFIDVDGDVGIGTASPGSALDVAGSLQVNDANINVGTFTNTGAGAVTLQMDADAGVDSWQFGVRGNDTFIVTPTGTIAAPVFIVDTAGNVTIPGGSSYNGSDRNKKHGVATVEPTDILAKVAGLPLATWSWKTEDTSVRHIGPMAQDFAAAFGLGRDDVTIAPMDATGVALAAIQGLNHKIGRLEAVEAENAALRTELAERLSTIELLLQTLSHQQ